MSETQFTTFGDGERVSHPVKGAGTVKSAPEAEDLVVPAEEDAEPGQDHVYVVWDDDRFPVEKVPASELEAVQPPAVAITTDF